jgi:hypothetical protein
LWITERIGKRVTRVNPTDGSRTVAVTIDEVHQTLANPGAALEFEYTGAGT